MTLPGIGPKSQNPSTMLNVFFGNFFSLLNQSGNSS